MKYAVLGVLALSGCAGAPSGEVVYLANAGGKQAQCGPYSAGPKSVAQLVAPGSFPSTNPATEAKLRGCIEDFQKAGYQRIMAPAAK